MKYKMPLVLAVALLCTGCSTIPDSVAPTETAAPVSATEATSETAAPATTPAPLVTTAKATEAPTEEEVYKNWQEAYHAFLDRVVLSEGYSEPDSIFGVADLDDDGDPELVIALEGGVGSDSAFAIYTYREGRVVPIADLKGGTLPMSAPALRYAPEEGLITIGYGRHDVSTSVYYALNDLQLNYLMSVRREGTDAPEYDIAPDALTDSEAREIYGRDSSEWKSVYLQLVADADQADAFRDGYTPGSEKGDYGEALFGSTVSDDWKDAYRQRLDEISSAGGFEEAANAWAQEDVDGDGVPELYWMPDTGSNRFAPAAVYAWRDGEIVEVAPLNDWFALGQGAFSYTSDGYLRSELLRQGEWTTYVYQYDEDGALHPLLVATTNDETGEMSSVTRTDDMTDDESYYLYKEIRNDNWKTAELHHMLAADTAEDDDEADDADEDTTETTTEEDEDDE